MKKSVMYKIAVVAFVCIMALGGCGLDKAN